MHQRVTCGGLLQSAMNHVCALDGTCESDMRADLLSGKRIVGSETQSDPSDTGNLLLHVQDITVKKQMKSALFLLAANCLAKQCSAIDILRYQSYSTVLEKSLITTGSAVAKVNH